MISYDRQANQAGQILLAFLTIGTDWTPERGAVHKMSLMLFVWLVLWLAGTRKMQKTEGRGGARSITLRRLPRRKYCA